jgi:hypothetical protein
VLTCSGGGEVQVNGDEGWIKVVQNAIFATEENEAREAVEKGITSLGKCAFREAKNLKEITLPDSLTSIGGSVFYSTALTSVDIPDSVTEIGSSAFSGCKSLSSVTLPQGLTRISSSLFENCESLTGIEIPNVDVIASPMEMALYNGTTLTIYGPGGGVLEGWLNKQIAEKYPNCKFVANG